MQVIKPLEINDSNLTSTIAEPDLAQGEVVWDPNREVYISLSKRGAGIVVVDDLVYVKYEILRDIDVYDKTGNLLDTITGTTQPLASSGLASDGVYLYYMTNIGVGVATVTKVRISDYSESSFTVTVPTPFFEFGEVMVFANGSLFIYGYNTVTDQFMMIYGTEQSTRYSSYNMSDYPDAINPEKLIGASFIDDEFKLLSYGDVFTTNIFDDYTFIGSIRVGGRVPDTIFYDENEVWCTSSNNFPEPFAVHGFGFIGADLKTKLGLYRTGEQVIKTSSHKLYQATTETTDDPEIGAALTPPSWAIVSATNKYRAFDYVKNLQSSGPSPLVIDVEPGQIISALAVFNISGASSVNVTMTDPVDGVVYDKDIDMIDITGVVNMWQYFFYEHVFIDKFVVDDLPPYKNATLTITFTGAADILVGEVATGRGRIIGKMVKGSSSDRKSYSTITTDVFGNTDVTVRPSATYTNYMTSISTSTAAYVERVLKESLDVPTLFIGDDWNNVKLVDLGYYERSPLVRQNPSLSEINIKVRGLV